MKRTIAAITILFIFASVGAATNKEVKLPVSINKDGTLNRPPHYLQWVNVGTTLLPKGTVNIIDNLPIPNDEYIDTYVEPQSFAIYMATGVWPNGTQIAKEFTPAHPAEAGEPVSESHYNGLGMIIKDTERYTAETGYLGFFQFGHHPEPYSTTAELMPREVCSTCHEASAGDQQNIFADHHIGLKR